jgi:hypothetical protein
MWQLVERTIKIAGIVGGLAAAVGVWIQLKDLNDREQKRAVADWQSAIIYQIRLIPLHPGTQNVVAAGSGLG